MPEDEFLLVLILAMVAFGIIYDLVSSKREKVVIDNNKDNEGKE